MLTEFATRERLVDARGIALGIAELDAWEIWRQEHGCPDDCPECLRVVDAFSTVASE